MLVKGQTMLFLWRKAFLFTKLNMFAASTRRIASVCCSLYILDIAWMAASDPDSCPACTCNGPTDVMIISHSIELITFPTSTSPASIGSNPGFLFNGIRQQDRKASRVFARSLSMRSFFIILAMVVHKSEELSANCLDVRIHFQPSASIPKGPELPLVFGWYFRNLIWWILSAWSDKRNSTVVGADLRCFYFKSIRVVSVRDSIPFYMLLVISLIALSTLPFLRCSTNVFESYPMVLGALNLLMTAFYSFTFL